MEKMTCKRCGGELADMGETFYCWNCDMDYVIENGKPRILTCENCGGDIALCGDHYECEVCGKKYLRSAQEDEEIVPATEADILKDVKKYFGAGYRCENNGSLSKDYSLARKYLSEKRYVLSLNYYHKLSSENPFDWEVLFYSAYSQIRVKPDLEYSAEWLSDRLGDIIGDIRNSVPKEKQRDTYLEIGAECLNIGLFLIEKAEEEKRKTGCDNVEEATNKVMEMIATVSLLVYNAAEDFFASKIIVNAAKDLCALKNYSGELADTFKENYDTIEKTISETNEQIQKIKGVISELRKMTEEDPLRKEAAKIEKQIALLLKEKSALGIFQAKKKKELQAEIDELSAQKNRTEVRIFAREEAAEEEIERYTELLEELSSKI